MIRKGFGLAAAAALTLLVTAGFQATAFASSSASSTAVVPSGPLSMFVTEPQGAGQQSLGAGASVPAGITPGCTVASDYPHMSTTARPALEVSGHGWTSCNVPVPMLVNNVTIYLDLGLGFTSQIGFNDVPTAVDSTYDRVGAGGACTAGSYNEYTNEGVRYIAWPNGTETASATYGNAWVTCQ